LKVWHATGFIQFEYSLAGKWLELLKEIAPRVTRVAILREPGAAGIGQWAIIQAVAQSFGMGLKPIDLAQSPDEVKRAISSFAGDPNGGLVVVVSAKCLVHQDLIIELAAHYQLPAVYPYHSFVSSGGLITYGTDISSLYRHAAGYVDRILKGENPADLPVQTPNKYELVINLKTARSLGLDVPPTLLARADQVIE
jgi:putative ABC transport system substrate-binding protein